MAEFVIVASLFAICLGLISIHRSNKILKEKRKRERDFWRG